MPIRKSGWSKFAAVLASAAIAVAFAVEYADVSSEPPVAVSPFGGARECLRTDDGLVVPVFGGTDARLEILGVDDGAEIVYAVLDACGMALACGEGTSIDLSRFPEAAEVLIMSPSGSVDWTEVPAVESSSASGAVRRLPVVDHGRLVGIVALADMANSGVGETALDAVSHPAG